MSVGRTDLGPLGLGTAALGDLYRQVPEADAVDTIHAALAAGIAYVDTAPHYALGVAERRVGLALRGVPRDAYVLSTKVGRLLVPGDEQPGWLPSLRREWDFSARGVTRSLHESLDRLGLDRVDIAYLHDPELHLEQAVDEALPALLTLREQGVLRAVGVGSGDVTALTRLVATGRLDVALVAGRHTLLDGSALADVLPTSRRTGTAVVVGGVYNSGILADPEGQARFDYGPAGTGLVDRARAIGRVCRRHGVSLRAAALQYPFGDDAVRCVLLGPADRQQLADNLADFAVPVPDGLWAELRAAGLLPDRAPVPAESRGRVRADRRPRAPSSD